MLALSKISVDTRNSSSPRKSTSFISERAMKSIRHDERITRQVQASLVGIALPTLFFPLSPIVKTVISLLVTFLVTGSRPYWIYVILKTLPRDLRIIIQMLKAIYQLYIWEKRKMTVAKRFHQLTLSHPDKVAFYADDGDWTYKRLSMFAARFAYSVPNTTPGVPVALALGPNAGPRLLGASLGFGGKGVPTALLPPAARGAVLRHALKASAARTLIYSGDMVPAIAEILDEPEMNGVTLFQYNIDKSKHTPLLRGASLIDPDDETLPDTLDLEELAKGKYMDNYIYIYTSGTTGLPKAAIITNARYLMICVLTYVMGNMDHNKDIMYTPLPLHHTAGGILGSGQALVMGVSVVQRNKFSASNFWNDCFKYNCTVAQYIGETCRFLLLANERAGSPPVPQHKLRMMIGNGLKSTIWAKFKDTFRIPQIYELYGATEGNTNMINNTSKEGAIGFLPRFASYVSPILLIRCNNETGEPFRDSLGLCRICGPCEPGLLIGKVNHKKKLYSYTGYVDKEANEKKMVRDVLVKGDCYFNSGDVLVMDDFGFFYFKDRTGDTFRWRGENVSTAEVEGVLTSLMGLTDIVVYGVEIPNVEGKAGMAAVVDTGNQLDLENLVPIMSKSLPPFARPLFLRVLSEMPLTTTFKIIKTDLRKEGFDVNNIKDKIYFLDGTTSTYVPLTLSLYNDICEGRYRL